MNVNKVFIGGTITRDPEIRYTSSGTAVCAFSVAVNERYGDRENAVFVACVAWKETAEIVKKHFGKGSRIFVEGKISQEEWTDKNTGEKRGKTKVTALRIDFVDRKASGYGGGGNPAHSEAKANGYQPQRPRPEDDPPPPSEHRYQDKDLPPREAAEPNENDGDDIPF